VDFFDPLDAAGLLGAAPDRQLKWLNKHYPYCLSSIDGVRRARGELSGDRDNSGDQARWWLFARPRPEMRRMWRDQSHIVIVGRAATKIWNLSSIPRIDPQWGLPVAPSDVLNVLPSSGKTAFAVLQSALGELHVRRNSSTLKSDLRFSPEYALAGFPFPWPSQWSQDLRNPYPLPAPRDAQVRLDHASERLTEARNRLLTSPETLLPEVRPVPNDWGPTELYNRYDDSTFVAPGIAPLREAHVALLDAVLGAYAADATLTEAGPMFAVLRDEMVRDADHGWTFDRPWIDGSQRFVPKASFRRRIIEALLQANLDRWVQEIDLIAAQVAGVVANQPALAGKLQKGVDVNGLASALKGAPIQVHPEDAQAVLAAGVRRGEWVRFDHGPQVEFRWVGSATSAERRRVATEARKAQAKAEAEAEKLRRQSEAEEASRRAAQERARQPRAKPQKVQAPRPEPEGLLGLLAADDVDPHASDPVLALVVKTRDPLGKADILAASGVAEEDWERSRRRLDEDSTFVRLGTGRGTRYLGWTALLDHVEAAITAADQGAGALKGEVMAAMEARGVPVDDEVWKVAIRIVLESGRASKSGQAKGTRYHRT
jgi:hypothetical protein